MRRHAEYIRPKFDVSFKIFFENFGDENEWFRWTKPKGGYFISLYVKPGCAKKVVGMSKDAGVILTEAGSSFPYGIDKLDSHIRFAPTYASLDEVKYAAEIICAAVKEFVK